ncbi:RDD family protein [Streptomyces gobiensis]|uniref:RDD family protein n=1 Tax=Streptomyces gobiensis TaxID=2875706 RepID=UPI003BB113A6|nr:RDD family protein [Streptomyces gobiensis]
MLTSIRPDRAGPLFLTILVTWLTASLLLYFALPLTLFGCTLGKRICGVQVTHQRNGECSGFWRAVGREAFWLISLPTPVPWPAKSLWCCWDKPFQLCLHDKVSGTVVVRRMS